MKESTKIDFANTLRGFAALLVLISHYYGVFWLNRASVATFINAPELSFKTHVTPEYIFLINTIPSFNWGSFGVALFFIISGFVIPFSLHKYSCVGFSINRVMRIIPTYFVGFTLTLVAVLISSKYYGREWPFTISEVLIHYIPGIRDIMWSKHIDGIVWTLEIEMKFYLLCILLIVWFRRYSLMVFFTPIALFVIALCLNSVIQSFENNYLRLALTYMMVSQFIIYMFIGVMFHYMYCRKIDLLKGYLGISGLFAMFCIHWLTGPYKASVSLAWSYAFALLIFIFAYSFPNIFKSNKFFYFFADISYPLYVIHGVAGYVALRILLDIGIKDWLALLLVTATFIFFAWVIHVLIESPSQKLGKSLGLKFIARENFY